LAVFRTSNIIANNFKPLNEALGINFMTSENDCLFMESLEYKNGCLYIQFEQYKAKVRYKCEGIVCWNCVDESATLHDKTEIIEFNSFYQILSKSIYLDYVTLNHSFYIDMNEPVKHYRFVTSNDVIDIVSSESPLQIEQMPNKSLQRT